MANSLVNVLASLVVVAMITTLVLPGRQTPQVINAAGNAFSNDLRASMGMH